MYGMPVTYDEVGAGVDLEGTVLDVEEALDPDDPVCKNYPVVVLTEHGDFHGFSPWPVEPGDEVILRCYDAGGGWYPDDMVIGRKEK